MQKLIKVGSAEDKQLAEQYRMLQAEHKTYNKAFDVLERQRKQILARYKPKLGDEPRSDVGMRYIALNFAFTTDNGDIEYDLKGYPESLIKQVVSMHKKFAELSDFKDRIDKKSKEYNEQVREIRYQ